MLLNLKQYTACLKDIYDIRLFYRLAFSLLLIFPFATLAEESGEWSAQTKFAPQGRLIDVDGHQMHINCVGNKSPTIILESGAGGFSLEWVNIQKALSKYVRICAYDRAGYGWSEMGPLPRTTKRITMELYTLLQNAGIHGPYILVGHSFGGYTAQYFARRFKNEIAGLVLIDSSHPEQVFRLPENQASGVRRSIHRSRQTNARVIMHENFPETQAVVAYQLMNTWAAILTLREELAGFAISAKQLLEAGPMPPVRLVVLTRGKRVWQDNDYGNAMEKIWMEMQNELPLLNNNATHTFAETSGHSIHLDQPKLVVDAIHDVLYAFERSLKKQGS